MICRLVRILRRLSTFLKFGGPDLRVSLPGRLERLLAGFTSTIGVVVFLLAASIDPYEATGKAKTFGVHQQLGLPPCIMLEFLGVPCPSCGMTTSVSLVVHGDPVAAWQANMVGVFLSAGGGWAVAWLALLAAGMPRRDRLSAECTVLYLAVGGALLLVMRYVGLLWQMSAF
jgi:hypothetical protein